MMRPGNAPARALRPGRSSSPGNRPEDGGPRAAPGFPPGGRDCMSPSSCVPGRTPRFRFCPWPPAWPRSVERTAGIPGEVRWPNDIVWQGRKLGGILCESGLSGFRSRYAIVGLGLNLSQDESDFPEEWRARAGSLRLAGRIIDREDVLAAFLESSRAVAPLFEKRPGTWWTPFFSTPKPGRGKRSASNGVGGRCRIVRGAGYRRGHPGENGQRTRRLSRPKSFRSASTGPRSGKVIWSIIGKRTAFKSGPEPPDRARGEKQCYWPAILATPRWLSAFSKAGSSSGNGVSGRIGIKPATNTASSSSISFAWPGSIRPPSNGDHFMRCAAPDPGFPEALRVVVRRQAVRCRARAAHGHAHPLRCPGRGRRGPSAAVAAYEKYGGSCIVVDFPGTATTFDAVSAKGEYLGGAIAPES